jgi:hypothetical protein
LTCSRFIIVEGGHRGLVDALFDVGVVQEVESSGIGDQCRCHVAHTKFEGCWRVTVRIQRQIFEGSGRYDFAGVMTSNC